jgi:protease-4
MTNRLLSAGALSLVFLAAAGRDARSDPEPPRAERIFSPGRSIVADDTAEAIALNPANLGYLPAGEARWTGVNCPGTQKVACGHAFDLATPLLWGLGGGVRLDYVQTPGGTPFPFSGSDYFWLTWALGWKASDAFAIGLSLQNAMSHNPDLNGLFGISAGATFRPNPHFGFAVTAQDFNGPAAYPIPASGSPILDASYVFGLDFRPTGTRALDVGLEAKYLQGNNIALPRGIVSVDIPGLGRARGDVEVMNLPNDVTRAVVATAGLEINLSHAWLGGGVLVGNGLGPSDPVGEYLTLGYSAYVSPGVPRLARAVSIRLEGTPDARDHVHFLRALWKLSEREDVKAVTLVLRAPPASSLAHAEELADAIRLLRARGKKVLCSLEDGGIDTMYVCANADRTVLNPAGTFRFAGLRYQYFYLAGLLEKLGVKAEFVRISPHKSAPEMYTNTQAGEVAHADHEDLLRENEAVFVKDVAQGRHIPQEDVRAVATRGITMPTEARDAKLVDQLVYDDEVERATEELVGHHVTYEKYEGETVAPEKFGTQPRVAILYVDGDIVDGRSQHIPLIDMKLVGSYSIAETVKELRDDPTIRSVVLRIESPGGATTAADVMWRELSLLAQKKPLVVSMGTVAASGGYYIASAAQTIFAEPLTTTGSIGVFYGKADVSGLLQKIGVNVETYKTTPHADAESFFRGFTDEERAMAQRTIEQIYDTFLDRVSAGRHMSKADVDAVAKGRVWTGQEAYARHLVDKLGGIREALELARSLGGLPSDSPIVEAPQIQRTLVQELLSQAGIDLSAKLSVDALPVQVKDVARAVAPLVIYPDETPLMRLEWVPVEGSGR